MTATVQQIAEALNTALEAIVGLRNAPYLTDSITPPVVLTAIEEVVYHGAFGYSDVEHTFTVFAIVGRASERAGIEAMEAYMSSTGTQSVRAALELDPTLGGVVSSLIVVKSGPPSSLAVGQGGAVYIAVPFTVLVHA
ncbi:MAG: hypothetical protein JWO62_2570 [Acidimicrobiaceae bacterium]|nr:hypothetical protein [Acidimicrobiaceae bacterium]